MHSDDAVDEDAFANFQERWAKNTYTKEEAEVEQWKDAPEAPAYKTSVTGYNKDAFSKYGLTFTGKLAQEGDGLGPFQVA